MSARVLLVEDNDANRYLATFLLEKAGHAVIQAANGRAAVELAAAERPDIVLMDLQMPEMDGYEAAERIRALPGLAHVPLVAVTSFAMHGDRERAAGAGFTGYIEKPISTATFVSQIERILHTSQP